MDDAGNGEGRRPEPVGEGQEPEPSRDTSRDKLSLAINILLGLFADDVSDWIIQAGQMLMDCIGSL
ncbi:hypothetical protein ACFWZK_26745 [[Kitasatospora] papulosa]|uniref:hypothetical protein n=1 Tax=[Kitasatospora] papulosa TaxID=1464011 RepID=UPI0036A589F3